MRFAAPEWFFLLPLLAVLAWRWPAARLTQPLRALALVLLVLVLAAPQLRLGGGGLDVWLLVDRSASAGAATAGMAEEAQAILERSRGAGDRAFAVDFAGEAVRRDRSAGAGDLDTQRTRLGLALDYTLAQLDAERPARLLVLTDGYATEPLGAAAEGVLGRGVAVDYRLVPPPAGDDVRVGAVQAPARALQGEAFLLEFEVVGDTAADGTRVPWQVVRNGQPAASGEAVISQGRARVRLTDRAPAAAGAVRYEIELSPAADARPENNRAEFFVETTGGPRAILLTAYPDDPLAALLAAQGFVVDVATSAGAVTPAHLTGARLVVLNNVAATGLAPGFAEALEFFVTEQGGGLLMVGGERSFASGGWFSSAIDPVLPVSMELRREHRRLATALAIVMDRSGSMGMAAGGGRTKMDLADAGAARAVELLGELDAVAVHAVDSTAHEIVGLAQVGPNRARITDAVRRIASGGGGIFVFEGLQAGWEQLQRAEAGQKHLVLFSDAADSEEPGNYQQLLDLMRASGATVSVIGLGTEGDSDAGLLKDIARIGGGRIFFTAQAEELPAIFAQETVAVARSLFVKEPTPAAGTPGWAEVAARPVAWLDGVDGYNLTYLRPGATAALLTTDDNAAPLVAAWQRGAGRAAAVTFPLGGNFSARARAWPAYGDFVQTLGRWLAGVDVPPGLALLPRVSGEVVEVDLFYDETWAARLASSVPELRVAEGVLVPGGGETRSDVRTVPWERLAPGQLRARLPLAPGRVLRGAARVGEATLAFGPLVAPVAAEWSFDRARLAELRDLAQRSGGVERIDLSTVWRAPRRPQWRDLQLWGVVALVVVLVLEALATRVGWEWRWRRRRD